MSFGTIIGFAAMFFIGGYAGISWLRINKMQPLVKKLHRRIEALEDELEAIKNPQTDKPEEK
jgi:uncharacterized membrane protein YdjX (TVP38/TMEM64 family)